MTPTLQVHRGAVPAALRDATAAVLADAFADDAWTGHESGRRSIAAARLLMQVAVDSASRRGGLVVATDPAGAGLAAAPVTVAEAGAPLAQGLIVGASTWVPASRRGGGCLDAMRAGALRLPVTLGPLGLLRVLRDEAASGRAVAAQVRPRDAYLWVLGVRRDRHGNGFGRTLIEATMADAATAGHERVVLSTHDRSNVALYEAMGFTRVDSGRLSSGLVLHVLARPT